MVQAVRMPMMGNTMETGLLVEWHVDEGDEVTDGTVLGEVESEKASAEVTADQDGTLARVDVDAGESVPPGTVLGVVLGPDESLADAPEPRSRVDDEDDAGDSEATPEETGAEESAAEETAGESDDGERAAPGARKLAREHDVDLAAIDGNGPEGAVLRSDVEAVLDAQEADGDAVATGSSGHDFSSPSTRRLARELGVSLDEVEGQGIGGRITESDVRAAAGQAERPATTESAASSGTTTTVDHSGVTITEEEPLSGMRGTIADRMSQSARQAPHVTLNREIDVERAFETAEELSNQRDASIGFTDLLVGASVRALAAYPVFNAWFEDETIRYVAERNVAVAVDTDRGLLTPVIRSAGERSLAGIAAERRRLTEVVLDGQHTMDDLQGGTFTITNLGMFGVDSFDPIINPPQVAILGVGRVREDGDGRTCTLSLSFDHRVVDGADAARFLDTLTEGVESPSLVVADRSGARTGTGGETHDESATGDADIATVVTRDVAAQADEIAASHDWPVPDFEVALDGGRPSIAIGSPNGATPATTKRLLYAACRESAYADTISGLRDPEIVGV
ncbi:2-oxo acid dehydrogenase subunit E2 [Halorientalis salina]|uniref:2-oxo acid dehydrogenase subunit E2 n=1 Tax=Halorientalis salina TaxID=2932266 RepID=UPI0010AB9D83|nr:2-oxo acid dehydrogenase subunit E2 [Halorientalis salina]